MTKEIVSGSVVAGTIFSITCDENHLISDYNLATTECGADGKWTNSLPTCEKGIVYYIITNAINTLYTLLTKYLF